MESSPQKISIADKIIKQIDLFTRKEKITFSIILIFIMFHVFFERIIEHLFVDSFFNTIKSSIINDLIVGLLFILVSYRLITNLKNNFYISDKSFIISTFLLVSGLYYRISESVWLFTSTYLFESIKYLDLVLIFLFTNFINRLCYKKKEPKVDSRLGFCFDNPNKDPDKAIQNRSIIAKKIAEEIKNTCNSESSFAIGVTSEWGRGKTSFINLIENIIKEDNKRIVVHFNPWLNNDEKSLCKSFFDELSIPLKKYNRELSDDLLRYAELLSTVDAKGYSKLADGLQSVFTNKNDNLRTRFDNINNAIKASGLQIVILIDDVDRLFEKEIVEVLRLIRNSANFANTIFIVAYDRNYLISSLKKANDYKPNLYLDKIFQLEIALPPFEKSVIIERLKEVFSCRLTKEDQEEFDKLLNREENIFGFHGFRYDLITNLRDINRLANSFFISYESLKGEIVLVDLLNIELLRVKYLGVYNLLAFKYQSFLTTTNSITNVRYVTLKMELDKDGNPTENVKIKKYLESNFPDVGLSKNQIEDAYSYICAIFPFQNTYSNISISLISVRNPISVDRYFHYNLLNSNLSEVEFSNSRFYDSEQEFLSKIDVWVGKGLQQEVSDRLEIINLYSSKEDYEKIIKSIFYFASIKKDEVSSFIGFDNKNLLKKLDSKNVSHLYDIDEFTQFVKNIFESQSAPYSFVSDFINFIFIENSIDLNGWNFIVEMEWLIQQKISFFKSYISSIEKFDYYVFWLFNDCNYSTWKKIGNYEVKQIEVKSETAPEIFKECARKLKESFIKSIIIRGRLDKNGSIGYSINQIILKVWNDWNEFESFLDEFSESEVLGLSEFKEFFSRCKNVNFQRYIEFEFAIIDLSGLK